MRNLILFASYWNEKEWINESLEQILKIDPVEIIICDGCFDPKQKEPSTDGTREILTQFVKDQSYRARLVTPVKCSTATKGIQLYKKSPCREKSIFSLGRVKASVRAQIRHHQYRVNQALTFAHMARISSRWQPGMWVMTADADQFYTDSLLDSFDLVNDRQLDYNLISATEYTFPESFGFYTPHYETRMYNNMPVKIMDNMAYYPTRHLMLENAFSSKHAAESGRAFFGGIYHHYKFRTEQQRQEQTYTLGDRRPPRKHRFQNLVSSEGVEFPEIITKSKKYSDSAIGAIFPCPVM